MVACRLGLACSQRPLGVSAERAAAGLMNAAELPTKDTGLCALNTSFRPGRGRAARGAGIGTRPTGYCVRTDGPLTGSGSIAVTVPPEATMTADQMLVRLVRRLTGSGGCGGAVYPMPLRMTDMPLR